jgi:uncharacterized circularly permuted ATP-grasp superfamily protein/uncharacterized alpha-E superfamily protein
VPGSAKTPASSPGGLLAEYPVDPGVADELFDASGAMRPVWVPFMEQLAKLSPEEIGARIARGDQYLRDAGVFFRRYDDDAQQERDWPLSHVPVILHDREWTEICEGLRQRADLLERVMADLYGPGDLVSGGHLPVDLVAQNPEWLRPLVGVKPASGHFLHLLAFEIGRSPDGSWLVLGDRAQAPSGAGFALENRVATRRMFPDPFPGAHVRRLAGFFRTFREAMEGLPGGGRGRAAILSPGPGTDTYFEHAYAARYLGMSLLEGEDLIVENGIVQMRTVAGPQPVRMLWRRLDAAYADPLELDESSQIGTPGLVEALRQSNVTLVNALGSGILETRAFMAFLPKLSRHLMGEKLKLPNIATWWCGQETERAYVKANAASMFIGDALSCGLPFDIGAEAAVGGVVRGGGDKPLADWIDAAGPRLVGQEAVTLSTSPAWVDGKLVPRPMSIRVFAARTPEGWTFLPGGYARIGRSGDATALSMQQGGSVADVWVMRDAPVPGDTLLEPGSFRRPDSGVLPSRAADNLFWLGRYIERTEGAIRLFRAYHTRRAVAGDPDGAQGRRLADGLAALFLDVRAPIVDVLAPSLEAARDCAGKVRDRFSVDGWTALTDLTTSLQALSGQVAPGDDMARALTTLLRKITGFSGLVQDNMHRDAGWRFLTLGRALERADATLAVLRAFVTVPLEARLSGVALEYADSRITHQRRYRIDPMRDTVVDLVALDASNPRAVLYQLREMRRIAEELPAANVHGRLSAPLRLLVPLEADLSVAEPGDLDAGRLEAVQGQLQEVSAALAASYLA